MSSVARASRQRRKPRTIDPPSGALSRILGVMASRRWIVTRSVGFVVLALSIARCSAEDPSTTGETTPGSCKLEGTSFEKGDPTGHADPAGAKAAGQARAGRITSASQIRQPKDARQKVHVGDFLLANDKIALYIEDNGLSDGYARFGGEILAVDKVGDLSATWANMGAAISAEDNRM
jgi:hypothetical protein